jgi:hypothetical protein
VFRKFEKSRSADEIHLLICNRPGERRSHFGQSGKVHDRMKPEANALKVFSSKISAPMLCDPMTRTG